MQGYATVNLAGKITDKPVIRWRTNGDPVAHFQVAVSRPLETDFHKQPYVHYFDCEKVGPGAEDLARMFDRNDLVEICGKLHHKRWDTRGTKGNKVVVDVTVIDRLKPVAQEEGAAS